MIESGDYMNNVKKVFQFLSSVLFYSVLLILVVIVLMFLSYYIDKQVGLKKGESRSPLFGAYVIISESMIPSINVYDAVLTVRADESKIKKYDIITFISKEIETKGTPITHRVIDIVHDPDDEKDRKRGEIHSVYRGSGSESGEMVWKKSNRIRGTGDHRNR